MCSLEGWRCTKVVYSGIIVFRTRSIFLGPNMISRDAQAYAAMVATAANELDIPLEVHRAGAWVAIHTHTTVLYKTWYFIH